MLSCSRIVPSNLRSLIPRRPYTSDFLPSLWHERTLACEAGQTPAQDEATDDPSEDLSRALVVSGKRQRDAAGARGGGSKQQQQQRGRLGTAELFAQVIRESGMELEGDDDGEEDGEWQPEERDLRAAAADRAGGGSSLTAEQTQQVHEQIRAMLAAGMLGPRGAAAGGGRRREGPRAYRPPRGRRHHSVMIARKQKR